MRGGPSLAVEDKGLPDDVFTTAKASNATAARRAPAPEDAALLSQPFTLEGTLTFRLAEVRGAGPPPKVFGERLRVWLSAALPKAKLSVTRVHGNAGLLQATVQLRSGAWERGGFAQAERLRAQIGAARSHERALGFRLADAADAVVATWAWLPPPGAVELAPPRNASASAAPPSATTTTTTAAPTTTEAPPPTTTEAPTTAAAPTTDVRFSLLLAEQPAAISVAQLRQRLGQLAGTAPAEVALELSAVDGHALPEGARPDADLALAATPADYPVPEYLLARVTLHAPSAARAAEIGGLLRALSAAQADARLGVRVARVFDHHLAVAGGGAVEPPPPLAEPCGSLELRARRMEPAAVARAARWCRTRRRANAVRALMSR